MKMKLFVLTALLNLFSFASLAQIQMAKDDPGVVSGDSPYARAQTPPREGWIGVGSKIQIKSELIFQKTEKSSKFYIDGKPSTPSFWHMHSNYCAIDYIHGPGVGVSGFDIETATSYIYGPGERTIIGFDSKNNVKFLDNGLRLTCNIWMKSILNRAFGNLISAP